MKLSVRATVFASALTALVMGLLALPFHIARWHGMAGTGQGAGSVARMHPWMYQPMHPWMYQMMTQHGVSGWPVIAWILLAIVSLMVCAGLAGAIFAAIYNAFAPRQA
ncbi:MAG: hypothetical protein ACYC8W_08600 [Candidatus Tyrphobacter sp.]